MPQSLFVQLGGEPALRAVIDRFVDRVFDDLMIGFHFRQANRKRVKVKEYEHAAAHLGAELTYSGRPLAEAHGPHAILSGHFARRLKILEEVFQELDVPAPVRAHWLAQDASLRDQITGDSPGHCDERATWLRSLAPGRTPTESLQIAPPADA